MSAPAFVDFVAETKHQPQSWFTVATRQASRSSLASDETMSSGSSSLDQRSHHFFKVHKSSLAHGLRRSRPSYQPTAKIASMSAAEDQGSKARASGSRSSFDTDVTLLDKGGKADVRAPDSSSSQASERQHARPFVVSDDVQAILQGRMRGGGLQLGGVPLRATAQGKPEMASKPSASASTSASAEPHKRFGKWRLGKHTSKE